MFDFSMGEIVIIGAVALIAIGPKELPGVLRTVGQWTVKVRRMASEFQNQFQEAMREAEMADLKKDVDTLTDTAAKAFNTDFTSPFEDPLNLKEATKWEPKTDGSTPGEPKPADASAADSAAVTPDGYLAPAAPPGPRSEPHVALTAEAVQGAPPPGPTLPEGSGQMGAPPDAPASATGGVPS
jgi:sec-independent protein translocase protein TatB